MKIKNEIPYQMTRSMLKHIKRIENNIPDLVHAFPYVLMLKIVD